jgi:hypothetical protein
VHKNFFSFIFFFFLKIIIIKSDNRKSPYFWPRLLLCKLSYTFPWFALARASIFSSQLLALAVINKPEELIVKLLDDHDHLFRLGNRIE